VLLVVQFADLLEALAATPGILKHNPAAVEVLDKYILDSTRLNPEASRLRDFLVGDPGAVLIIEFYGERARRVAAAAGGARSRFATPGIRWSLSPRDRRFCTISYLELRKLSLGLSMAERRRQGDFLRRRHRRGSQRLRDYIAEFQQSSPVTATTAGVYAHASVGCLHVRPSST